MRYRAEIDGLRALAVVPVIFFHAGFPLFAGGFVGVDVFFVISGYLITTILIEDLAGDRFSILKFYERRARRILPALFFVMACALPFAWMWMLPSQLRDFSESLIAVSLFISNMLFARESGYFATAAEEKPLLHTWSLAVEEQYYLLFPVILFLVWRFGRRPTFWTIILLAAASLVISEWRQRVDPGAAFFVAPTRAWELLAGSICAFVVQRRGVRNSDLLSAVGLAALFFAIFAYDRSIPFPSLYTLVPVLGVVLLILHAGPGTRVATLLGWRLFVGIGLVSYSAYLWHQPLFAFARIRLPGEPSVGLMLGLCAASIMLAVVSWKFVEQPFRAGGAAVFRRRSRLFAASGAGLLLFVALGYAGVSMDGFEGRFVRNVQGDVDHEAFFRYMDERYPDCEAGAVAEVALYRGRYMRCKQSRTGEPDVVLLGDSHAEHLFPGLAAGLPDRTVAYYVLDGQPYPDNPKAAPVYGELGRPVAGRPVAGRPVVGRTVLLTMYFHGRVRDSATLRDGFAAAIRTLRAGGNRVILIGDLPRYELHAEDCVYRSDWGAVPSGCSMPVSEYAAQLEIYDRTLQDLSAEFGVDYVRIDRLFCDAGTCSMIGDGNVYYRDRDHLNVPGSLKVGRYLADIVRGATPALQDQPGQQGQAQ